MNNFAHSFSSWLEMYTSDKNALATLMEKPKKPENEDQNVVNLLYGDTCVKKNNGQATCSDSTKIQPNFDHYSITNENRYDRSVYSELTWPPYLTTQCNMSYVDAVSFRYHKCLSISNNTISTKWLKTMGYYLLKMVVESVYFVVDVSDVWAWLFIHIRFVGKRAYIISAVSD